MLSWSPVPCTTVVGVFSVAVVLVATGYAAAQPQEPMVPEGRSVVDGVFTERQARRGERWFVQMCEQCHRVRRAGASGGSCRCASTHAGLYQRAVP